MIPRPRFTIRDMLLAAALLALFAAIVRDQIDDAKEAEVNLQRWRAVEFRTGHIINDLESLERGSSVHDTQIQQLQVHVHELNQEVFAEVPNPQRLTDDNRP